MAFSIEHGNSPKLRVNEIFGPTFQGEGPHRGKLCYFIRLYDCNLQCTWCDTPYTWANSKIRSEQHQSLKLYPKSENMKEMTSGEIIVALNSDFNVDITDGEHMFVISGGEPLMQQPVLAELCEELKNWDHAIHIETAGTIAPDFDLRADVDHWTVSPKLQHSGNSLKKRYKPEVLQAFPYSKTVFKFVVMQSAGMDGEDFFEIDKIVKECEIDPMKVWIMPEGTDAPGQIRAGRSIAQKALDRGFNFTFRDHILLWDDKRGV